LHWAYRVKEMIDLMDAITVPTESMKEAISKFTDKPIYVIPDRVDLNEFQEKKVHEGTATKALWFGYSQNFDVLASAVNELVRNNLELLVVSNTTFNSNTTKKIEITNYKFKEDTYKTHLMQGDIILNPKTLSGKWKFKSNNKTLIAWALGIPVAEDDIQLKLLMHPKERIKEIELRTQELKDKWDIKFSVQEMKDVISKI